MSIKSKIYKRFSERLPKNKVFIIPTLEGFIFSTSTIVVILIGIVFSNNSILLIGFSLLIIVIFHAFTTNNNLEKLKVESFQNLIDGTSSFIVSNLSGKLETKKNIVYEVLIRSQEKIQKQYDSLEPKLTLNLNNISRGYYEVQRLRLSSTYPFGLFYAWKLFKPENNGIYVFPQLEGSGLKKIREEKVFIESKESKLSSDQKYKEHKKYSVGDNLAQVDWRRFAKDRNLYVKLFESNESEEISFVSYKGMSEKEISQLAFWMNEAFFDQNVWHYKSERVELKNLTTRGDLEACLKDLTLL